MKSTIKLFKYLCVGFFLSLVLAFWVPAVANTFLETAYIRPRTLAFARGNFWVYADNKFSQSQQSIITSASRKLHGQMNDPTQRSKITDCALQRTVRAKPNKQTVENQLKQVFVNPASGNRPIKATVTYMWSEQDFVGRGTLGTGQFPEKGDLLRVALNSDYFGNSSQFSLRNDVDYWAATLAHEILHNLGYDHPQGKGDFITEFDLCVNFNGSVPKRFGLNGGTEDDIDDVYFRMKK